MKIADDRTGGTIKYAVQNCQDFIHFVRNIVLSLLERQIVNDNADVLRIVKKYWKRLLKKIHVLY